MTNDYNPVYDPAYDPHELITALEHSGYIVVVIDIDEQPRLLFGLADRNPTTGEIVKALKKCDIDFNSNRLIDVSHGNFYEIIF